MSIRTVLVTGSTFEPVTRADMKIWLRIAEEETVEDALIDSLITTARLKYETYTKRSLITQTFDAYFDDVPDDEACLPRAPLVSVTYVKAFSNTDATDTGGTAMSSSGYYVDVANEPGRIVPFASFTFPTATRDANPFIVRFKAGYSSSDASLVPESAKTRIKEMVAAGYEHRGDETGVETAMDAALCPDELALPEWG